MKILFISDIHGNHVALNAILKSYGKEYFSQIFSLGDMCGYLTGLSQVLSLFQEYKIFSLAGNHELMFNNIDTLDENKIYSSSIKESYLKSSIQEREYISELKPHYEITIDNVNFCFYHGGPNDHYEEYVFPNTLDENIYLNKSYQVYLFGHSHLQFVFKRNNVLFCNPGSVGMPRNGDFRAHGMIFDTQTMLFESIRIPYSICEIIDDYILDTNFNHLLFHNILFGKSSTKVLNKCKTKYFSKQEEDLLLIGKYDFYNTPFGIVLSLYEDNFRNVIFYVISYEDGSIVLMSNTLVFSWESELSPKNLQHIKKIEEMTSDKTGFFYKKTFTQKDNLKLFLVDELPYIFNYLNQVDYNNVKF